MRTLAVMFVLAVLHAPFAAWLFLAVVWMFFPQPVRVRFTWRP